MDKFRRIIEGGYSGFSTDAARSIIRDSAEVSQYVSNKLGHFAYVQQLMNDKIIDEAMGRVRSNGEFKYDGNDGFTYTPRPRMRLNEQYPSQQVSAPRQSTNDVISRLDAMEREMQNLREENRILKSRYGMLK